MKLKLGFSPCPNDTFIFDAMVHGKIDTEGLDFEVVMEDVEALNQMVFADALDIAKLSYHAYLHAISNWQMLRSGSALGEGVGPLLISKKPMKLADVQQQAIAIPGKFTTANFLLKSAFGRDLNTKPYLFSDIEKAILDGTVGLGVIIHENRFTYQERGLHLVADLGTLWEEKEKLPIPLGGIAVSRKLDQETRNKVQRVLYSSIAYAFQNPTSSHAFVAENAQEMEPEVMQQHIALYVNHYTQEIDEKGKLAVARMKEKGQEWGMEIPNNKSIFIG
ncbi:MAG: 1,4-dihydroxy-6-naphthoate synthase [Flavobacteriales bacterium]|jgi:1,4-dihydroxy-6-naphthoate synthase